MTPALASSNDDVFRGGALQLAIQQGEAVVRPIVDACDVRSKVAKRLQAASARCLRKVAGKLELVSSPDMTPIALALRRSGDRRALEIRRKIR